MRSLSLFSSTPSSGTTHINVYGTMPNMKNPESKIVYTRALGNQELVEETSSAYMRMALRAEMTLEKKPREGQAWKPRMKTWVILGRGADLGSRHEDGVELSSPENRKPVVDFR